MRVIVCCLASFIILSVDAFQCSSDTILRMATGKRSSQLEKDCHVESKGLTPCENKDELEKAWNEFQTSTNLYQKAVSDCRKTASNANVNAPKAAGTAEHKIRHARHRPRRNTREEGSKDPRNIDNQPLPYSEPERSNRCKRQVCMTSAREKLNKLQTQFEPHCQRENMFVLFVFLVFNCLPGEDLPAGKQREDFEKLHKSRAQAYTRYLTQLSKCYPRGS